MSRSYAPWRTERSCREGYSAYRCVVNRLKHAIRRLNPREGNLMNSIIYIVGLVVIVIFVLGFLGLR